MIFAHEQEYNTTPIHFYNVYTFCLQVCQQSSVLWALPKYWQFSRR